MSLCLIKVKEFRADLEEPVNTEIRIDVLATDINPQLQNLAFHFFIYS
jgi:hypothetical protein